MRVLLLVGHSTGGIGAHVASLAAGLGAHAVDVTVGTSGTTAERFDLDAEVVWPAGTPTTRLRRLARLRALAATCDVLHAHGHQAGLLAVAVAATLGRRRRPAVVVSWHNAVLGSGPPRRARAVLEALQARRADLVTGASSDLVERAAALGARDAELAPVAAPSAGTWTGDRGQVRRDLAASDGVPAGAALVLTVSRIAPQKNLDVLVDAAARTGRDDVAWVVAGDGDGALLERLRARVAASRAPVTFLGARRDVGALMAAADVFALTSTWEARALVVQEAMAAGTPVVVTDTGGLPDLVAGAGLLVPVGDAGALANAVRGLLDDPAERARLADAGRARFAELPDAEDVVATWAGTYARLVTR
ncbi:MAG TPA: glycosyltransferase family 4 protein [Actinomycetales bacterium]|nr:glycosyltransferase family 4 protein [Actinomycetales bacterium]